MRDNPLIRQPQSPAISRPAAAQPAAFFISADARQAPRGAQLSSNQMAPKRMQRSTKKPIQAKAHKEKGL